MQFIKNGPDIPERLMQSHEDGRVVFFCGAGISYPAGLPLFSGLVEQLYNRLGHVPDSVQQSAMDNWQYDTAINLLESSTVGGRSVVRKELLEILNPDLSKPNATTTHNSLLTLSRTRKGKLRLITTNFDRIFEEVIEKEKYSFDTFSAPFLPVPKNKWDGLVYLHGLMPEGNNETALNNLVVSSGDFGLAYLNERWAARFVSELFRNYTICFVGYSLDDPVLRYMMDALAADRMLGESPPEMFAFGSYKHLGKNAVQNRSEQGKRWLSKNVTPILYRSTPTHSYLHKTLREWANVYRDGLHGKEQIVTSSALTKPIASTSEDNYIGRLMWALSDKSGLPAKAFSEMKPTPSLDWLEPLSEERFQYMDLERFGVSPNFQVDESLKFSFLRRPAPYDKSPRMMLFGNAYSAEWDEVMKRLAQWLKLHINNPKLILWFANNGGKLHSQFAWLIRNRLDELAKADAETLERIAVHSPDSIPSIAMCTLWRIALCGNLKSLNHRSDLYDWLNNFKMFGLTVSTRMELRNILAPRVQISSAIRWNDDVDKNNKEPTVKDLVDWEIVLSANHVDSFFCNLQKSSEWNKALTTLLNDFNSLLRDTFELSRELGGADDKGDLSYIHHPSISAHSQNRKFRDWTVLVELCRDAWVAVTKEDVDKAYMMAEQWWSTPFPIFKRLALFAGSYERVLKVSRIFQWLQVDNCWWLWSTETQREILRLLVVLPNRLDSKEQKQLEEYVLLGPPREMYKADISDDDFKHYSDRGIWLRLVKIQSSKKALGGKAQTKFDELSQEYPLWQVSDDEKEEFSFWMGSGLEPRALEPIPNTKEKLVDWLKQVDGSDTFRDYDWKEVCENDFSLASSALIQLSEEEHWPIEQWRDALQVWSKGKLVDSSWGTIANVVLRMPNEVYKDLSHGISWWIQAQSKKFDGDFDIFIDIVKHIIEIDYEDEAVDNDYVFRAINHPVGLATDALLQWWYRSPLKDEQGLPEDMKLILSGICRLQEEKFRYGRVILATHAITLYRVDSAWSEKYLLEYFDWQASEVEAASVWQGFLCSPRIYNPFLLAMKSFFLDTSNHYEKLGSYARQFADFFTFVALDRGDRFTYRELATATLNFPEDGLVNSAEALTRAQLNSGKNSSDYWDNRVTPYLRYIWPKSIDKKSPRIAEELSQLCIATKSKFSSSYESLKFWLMPLEHPDYVVHLLNESNICATFPDGSLDFLFRIIDENCQWLPRELSACLEVIVENEPELERDNRYLALLSYIERRRIDE